MTREGQNITLWDITHFPTLMHLLPRQGAVGIVAKPVQGAEKGGLSGFFGGVARGLVGAVAAPVTGTLSAFSKVSL